MWWITNRVQSLRGPSYTRTGGANSKPPNLDSIQIVKHSRLEAVLQMAASDMHKHIKA